MIRLGSVRRAGYTPRVFPPLDPSPHPEPKTRERSLASDLRGLSRLAVGATLGVTETVEQMHATIGAVPGPLAGGAPTRARGISGLVYRSVRGITRLVGHGLDGVFGSFQWMSGGSPSSSGREAGLAILNGVCGDFLEKTGNPVFSRLAPIQHRRHGIPPTEAHGDHHLAAIRWERTTG